MMFEQIRTEVQNLLNGEKTGHSFEHVQRVCDLACQIAREEKADVQIVELAALLHDVDDYKLFGQQSADSLSNAKRIMMNNKIAEDVQQQVCNIISTMGYSKALKGIRPQTLEGQIVSDADMLDAIGANGLVRCLAYALERCATVVFDEKIFPELNMSAEEYKKKNRASDNFINHFFEKLLRLNGMMFTPTAQKEAAVRHKFMVDFLREFFREQGLENWLKYLHDYEQTL